MEQELDLRPLFLALVRRWRLIAGLTVVCMVLPLVLVGLAPPPHVAVADILIVPTSTDITLDARFVTQESSLVTNPFNQRQGLIALASSTTLEATVREQLSPELLATLNQPAPGRLLGRVDIETEGDLVRVQVTGESEGEALALAEAWATGYQELINRLYNGNGLMAEDLDVQLAEAQARYDTAQQSLEEFLGQAELVVVEQRIAQMQALLDGATEADSELYASYMERVRELDLLINDARTLRRQVGEGSADGLANLIMRARAAGGDKLGLFLQVDGQSQSSVAPTAVEVESVIAALEQRRDELLTQAGTLEEAMAGGAGSSLSLSPEQRQQYATELATLRERQEALSSRQILLEENRNQAFESLKLINNKRIEQQIAASTPQVEVRFIGAAIEPQSNLRRLALAGVVGLALGLVLGVAVALVVDVVRPWLRRLGETAPGATPGDRPMPTS